MEGIGGGELEGTEVVCAKEVCFDEGECFL